MEWRSGSSGASLYAGVACLPIDFGYASADGVTLKVLSTADIADWSPAAITERAITVGADGKAILGDTDPMRFYRLGADLAE